MAQLSDTINKNGLVQRTEYWSRLPYGSSGDTLRTIITNLNTAYDKLLPILLGYGDYLRWDDSNHTDAPSGKTNIVSGQADYKITQDGNSLDILNITHARVLISSTETDYTDLERMKADDPRVPDVLSPNSTNTGIPSHFLEMGNRIYLYPEPNYSATNGLQIFFGREQVEFTVTGTSGDDTTVPGFAKQFHELLALDAAQTFVAVNRPEDANTLNLIERNIQPMMRDFKNFISLRHPTKLQMQPKGIKFR